MIPGQAKCIVLFAIIYSSSETKTSFNPKIIHGVDSNIEKWPFLVQIIYKNKLACGGTVITNRWVITAGHCFHPNLASKIARFKIYTDSTIAKRGEHYDVETIKFHKTFLLEPERSVADVALMKIKDVFTFSKSLKAIKVDFAERQLDTDYKACSTAGWGQTDITIPANQMVDPILQELHVGIIPHAECKQVFPALRSNLCVRAFRELASPCTGDSGGPLVCSGVLVGVVSYGDEECNNLTAFTKVASYYTWIRTMVKYN